MENNQYTAITSLKIFFGTHYYCVKCKIAYNNIYDHKNCPEACKMCWRSNCENVKNYACVACGKNCFDENCLRIHQTNVCALTGLCTVCGRKKFANHVCGDDEKWCPNCSISVKFDHQCFIMTQYEVDEVNKKKKQNNSNKKFNGYIFFDYEAYRGEDGNHVPNLIIAQIVCINCLDEENRCNDCSKMLYFENNNDFCDWLLEKDGFIALAHNMKGYDGVFIANYFLNNLISTKELPEMIATPTKLLQISYRGLKIIDSYSFLAMRLENFSKTFNLKELKKGFFPHNFNKPENFNYIGKLPPKEDYGYEYFSISKRKEFEVFYEQNKNSLFDFKNELRTYCESDVLLLTEGCLKFRKIIMQQTKRPQDSCGVDPFQVSITIASLCNYILFEK